MHVVGLLPPWPAPAPPRAQLQRASQRPAVTVPSPSSSRVGAALRCARGGAASRARGAHGAFAPRDVRLRSLAGAHQAALQQLCTAGLLLLLYAAMTHLTFKVTALQADMEELQNESVRHKLFLEDALARIATLEATVAVYYALNMQLAETRIAELRAENAMLRALLDANDG